VEESEGKGRGEEKGGLTPVEDFGSSSERKEEREKSRRGA